MSNETHVTSLTLETIEKALQGSAVALRSITGYQPAGGQGDKVFPPTYEGGAYAWEERILDGVRVKCVLLDSVQSQANRMELEIYDAWESGDLNVPVITVAFDDEELHKRFTVSSLHAPHRLADALLRDSEINGKPFKETEIGKALRSSDPSHATQIFRYCPTALLFGMWHSTELEKNTLGVKFARAIVSEIIGIDAVPGVKTGSRLDPAGITKSSGPIFKAVDGGWTLDETKAVKEKDKPVLWEKEGSDKAEKGTPAMINHGNIPPSISVIEKGEPGGVSIRKAEQTTVISLPALRRLRFPLDGELRSRPEVDVAARTVLAALALFAATGIRERGADLRSRCLLVSTTTFEWELLDKPMEEPKRYTLTRSEALQLLHDAIAKAKDVGIRWKEEEIVFNPSDELMELVKRSQNVVSTHKNDGKKTAKTKRSSGEA
ncbi:type I-U CRISPR-associated protein Cas7 [Heliobacterium gestii]|uniref:Type I-U CRISPR-associated protein Cas7 n=1 Tax=Heliomicrobium gestii TaxID=2699 RepID=A0A845LFX7_HELGE|nr:type I-U CRISPR-associated RAMP protein Csb1/Cas7u [Heliomicrobium gestii]MBM7867086.1 CRISPR-associated protein Csb1 [Heliomicrobium gestii]MZP43499.1 type I-U CRISPR-associated protein Cas7 [Heliomicrobium gestii]